ncbi:MAG: hypothetical protein IPJ20_26135 [Flammeovirgaceae bacterium]|nr:hypothetical protein [Flammeovirgaceae bacterium]
MPPVTGTSSSFNQGYSRYGYKIKGEQKSAYVYAADPFYIPTLDIQMVAGRNFDTAIASDTAGVIVNEALVRDMKWTDPLNEYLNWREDSVGLGSPIIGVVRIITSYHWSKSLNRCFCLWIKKHWLPNNINGSTKV